MSIQPTNPFRRTDPDLDYIIYYPSLIKDLQACILGTNEPPHISVVAERRIGAVASIRHFLRAFRHELNSRLRVIECDIADLPQRRNATPPDFWRDLIRLIEPKLEVLPRSVYRVSDRILKSKADDIRELTEDVQEFFDKCRGGEHALPPFLLVFYNFDDLPHAYNFMGDEWPLLRSIADLGNRYLIASYRPLRMIVSSSHYSNFPALFPPPFRYGLLTHDEVVTHIRTRLEIFDHHPMCQEWVAQHVITWGGRNPYCLRLICALLFDLASRQPLTRELVQSRQKQVQNDLEPYFDELYSGLKRDGLHIDFINAARATKVSRTQNLKTLVDIGYFLPEPADKGSYQIFSSLFDNYLVETGILSPVGSQNLSPHLSPQVQEILALDYVPEDCKHLLEDILNSHNHVQDIPDQDRFAIFYLVGIKRGLTQDELDELRRELTARFYEYCRGKGDQASTNALRATFHKRCTRLVNYYHDVC